MISIKKTLAAIIDSGIKTCSVSYGMSSSKTITFEGDVVDQTSINNDFSALFRAVVGGNKVAFSTDCVNKETLPIAIAELKNQSNFTDKGDEDLFIAKPDLKYHKLKRYNPALANVGLADLIALGKELTSILVKYDPRIINTSTTLQVDTSIEQMVNSKGLDLKSKSNSVAIYIEGMVKDGEEINSHSKVFYFRSMDEIDPKKMVEEFAKVILAKLGSKPGPSGLLKAVFAPKAIVQLIDAALGHLSMFLVDADVSLLKGKLEEEVFSKALTIIDNPINNTLFAESYDSEGYPCSNKVLVKKGVIKSYVYDLEMAKKYGTAPTGNGFGGLVIRPGISFFTVKKGSKSPEELIGKIKDGYVITEASGLHAGLDSKSLNFHASAEGFHVKDGKIVNFVEQFTVSGNILSLLKNVIAVANDNQVVYGGADCPSMLVKDVIISC